jgi:uncharacterized YccA/Bax inhibitor family protein
MTKNQSWIVLAVLFSVNLIFSGTLLYALFLVGRHRETIVISITIAIVNILFIISAYYIHKKVKKGGS